MPFKPLMHLSIFAALAACDLFGPTPSLSHAAAMFWCGPTDGPATAIVLAQEPVQSVPAPYPRVSVMIWQSVTDIAGHIFTVTSGAAAGAVYFPSPDKIESAISGTIMIRSVDAAKTVRGAVSLQFPSRIVETPFTAPWINNGMLCG